LVFLLDDLFLRALGISVPPFDAIWFLETLEGYARELLSDETRKKVVTLLKESRLLYELGELSRGEYEERQDELNRRLNEIERSRHMNLKQRINIIG